jgi:hypothetical protein
MKFSTRFASLVLAAGLVQGAFAAPRGVANASTASSAPGRASYVGIAADDRYCGSTTPCITASLLSDKSAIQAYVGIPTIKPFFVVGGGINYKYSLVGDSSRGFHIGMGIGLGAMNVAAARTFFINIQPLMGLHFHVADHVLLNFDTGLTFQIQTEGTSNLDLILGGNSILMGCSIQFGL